MDGQLTALMGDNGCKLKVCLEVTWVVSPAHHLQSTGLCCVASGKLSNQSPKGELRTLLLTRGMDWEASAMLSFMASPHAPAAFRLGLKQSSRRDVQQATGTWTTTYRPMRAHACAWDLNLTTEKTILQDAQVGMQQLQY